MYSLIREFLHSIIYLIPCHRKVERCFKIRGKAIPLCARCTCILLGYLFIPLLLLLNCGIPFYIGVFCQVPMLVDGYTQKKKLRESNNFLRAITGILSGFGLSVCIVAVVYFL